VSEDLLHKVDVRSISEPVLEVLRDLVGEAVRSALADRGLAQPAGALKPREAARYIGRSRSRLYELLEHDPLIQAASFKQGKSRLFLRENLDRWLQAQQLLLAASGSEGRLNDPVGVLGAPLAIILSATALGLLLAAVWAAAVGQSAVAAVFGIFGTFWLSYGMLVLGLDHNWFAITATAVLATVKLFLVAWLVVILMLTLATLRLPAAFTAVFALVSLALLLLLLAFANASPLGVPSTGLLKTAGYVVLVFAAVGVYLFYDAAQAGTGGKRVPLGNPLVK
jgi:hypothetical protein